MKKDKNYLLEKSTELALQVVQFCDLLFELRKNEIARQLLRSGTSIGANIREAQQAESAADFLHKLRLSAKECSETEYWIEIVDKSYKLKNEELEGNLNEVAKMLSASIYTTKMNLQNKKRN